MKEPFHNKAIIIFSSRRSDIPKDRWYNKLFAWFLKKYQGSKWTHVSVYDNGMLYDPTSPKLQYGAVFKQISPDRHDQEWYLVDAPYNTHKHICEELKEEYSELKYSIIQLFWTLLYRSILRPLAMLLNMLFPVFTLGFYCTEFLHSYFHKHYVKKTKTEIENAVGVNVWKELTKYNKNAVTPRELYDTIHLLNRIANLFACHKPFFLVRQVVDGNIYDKIK